jgi:predicted RNA-binding Zn ribbon-like protein
MMITTKPETREPPFEMIAGNLALDFINTLDDRPSNHPEELLKDYSSLARFGAETGILAPQELDYFCKRVSLMPGEAEAALLRARNLRDALYEIFSAAMNKQPAPQSSMDVLNENLHDAALHLRLIQRETGETKPVETGASFEWRFDDLTSSFHAILWPIARAGADLLASSQVALVRACSSPTCQWFFLDTSKNHHRRWCSMQSCGNRAKVRKFYAKKKTS